MKDRAKEQWERDQALNDLLASIENPRKLAPSRRVSPFLRDLRPQSRRRRVLDQRRRMGGAQ